MRNACANLPSCTVVVVGDVILDVYFMGEVRRLSPEAPVPIVHVKRKSSTLGGAGNVALNLAGLTCHADLVGVRGDDAAGRRLSEILAQHGIGDRLVRDPSRATTTKTRVIAHGQQLLRLDEEETWEVSVGVQDRLLEHFAQALGEADAVILSDYNKGVVNGAVSQDVIRRCKAKGVPVFVDPRGKEWERYRGATCITPNTHELEVVTGLVIESDESLMVRTAESLRDRHEFEWFLVTRGAKGMCLVGPNAPPLHISATAREVFDVSGAGDTVIATLAASAASGLPFPKAAELANVAAGIVVGKLGSQAIKRAELEAALRINGAGALEFGISKITTLDAAQVQVKAWQAVGEKIICTSGRFDVLHPGHVHTLRRAKELGNRLIVGVEPDSSAKHRQDPGTTAVPQHDRAYVLAAVDCVDLVVLCQEDSPRTLLTALRPDVLVRELSRDTDAVDGRDIVESYGGTVSLLPPLDGYGDD